MVSRSSLFSFSDTATPEIYTYGHPLSLHYALPIYQRVLAQPPLEDRDQPTRQRQDHQPQQHRPFVIAPRPRDLEDHRLQAVAVARDEFDRHVGRSEEHTSELQSLMRNSYAVFCLKKKQIITLLLDSDTMMGC